MQGGLATYPLSILYSLGYAQGTDSNLLPGGLVLFFMEEKRPLVAPRFFLGLGSPPPSLPHIPLLVSRLGGPLSGLFSQSRLAVAYGGHHGEPGSPHRLFPLRPVGRERVDQGIGVPPLLSFAFPRIFQKEKRTGRRQEGRLTHAYFFAVHPTRRPYFDPGQGYGRLIF